MIGLTHEALKTKPQMRIKVHQVKEGREVLEKLQEFSEENGKDDTEWRDFTARFNRLDAAVQLQQGAETLKTEQLGTPQRRAAVERRIQCSSHGDLSGVADQWRSCSSGWLPEDAEQRKWLLASHQRKWPLVQVKKSYQQKWLLAPHQWKWPLMRILPGISRPRGRWRAR